LAFALTVSARISAGISAPITPTVAATVSPAVPATLATAISPAISPAVPAALAVPGKSGVTPQDGQKGLAGDKARSQQRDQRKSAERPLIVGAKHRYGQVLFRSTLPTLSKLNPA